MAFGFPDRLDACLTHSSWFSVALGLLVRDTQLATAWPGPRTLVQNLSRKDTRDAPGGIKFSSDFACVPSHGKHSAGFASIAWQFRAHYRCPNGPALTVFNAHVVAPELAARNVRPRFLQGVTNCASASRIGTSRYQRSPLGVDGRPNCAMFRQCRWSNMTKSAC